MLPVMSTQEKQQIKDNLLAAHYNYAVSITERNGDTIGSIYLKGMDMLNLLIIKDTHASATLVISGTNGAHPNAHGVVRTTLPQRAVRSCGKGCWVDTRILYDPHGWYDYILKQGVHTAVITTDQIQNNRLAE